MPTVASEGPHSFRIYTRESAFEPPHVHVWLGNENVCRIESNGGAYMHEPPPVSCVRFSWPTGNMLI
jgi:hypothetical protein